MVREDIVVGVEGDLGDRIIGPGAAGYYAPSWGYYGPYYGPGGYGFAPGWWGYGPYWGGGYYNSLPYSAYGAYPGYGYGYANTVTVGPAIRYTK